MNHGWNAHADVISQPHLPVVADVSDEESRKIHASVTRHLPWLAPIISWNARWLQASWRHVSTRTEDISTLTRRVLSTFAQEHTAEQEDAAIYGKAPRQFNHGTAGLGSDDHNSWAFELLRRTPQVTAKTCRGTRAMQLSTAFHAYSVDLLILRVDQVERDKR